MMTLKDAECFAEEMGLMESFRLLGFDAAGVDRVLDSD
jgi:hypothetical protein